MHSNLSTFLTVPGIYFVSSFGLDLRFFKICGDAKRSAGATLTLVAMACRNERWFAGCY